MTTEEEITLDLTEDMICGELPPAIVQNFVCMLCYGIVIDPLKCSQCETVFCKKCIIQSSQNHNASTFDLKSNPEKFFDCFKKCGSKKCQKLGAKELQILGQLQFEC